MRANIHVVDIFSGKVRDGLLTRKNDVEKYLSANRERTGEKAWWLTPENAYACASTTRQQRCQCILVVVHDIIARAQLPGDINLFLTS